MRYLGSKLKALEFIKDTVIKTYLGKELIMSTKSERKRYGKRVLSDEEIEIFRKGLLTNPPVIRVLTLLNESRKNGRGAMTKYDVGAELGFVGDIGFTHYDAEFVVASNKSFNDMEGDSDKWARTIISWLKQVGWVVDGKELIAVEESFHHIQQDRLLIESCNMQQNPRLNTFRLKCSALIITRLIV